MNAISIIDDWVKFKGKNPLDSVAQKLLFYKLRQLKVGTLQLIEGREKYTFSSSKKSKDLQCKIYVENPAFYSKVAFGGTIGAGEAYMEGYFNCSDLAKLTQIMVRNVELLELLESNIILLSRPFIKLVHSLRINTLQGSKKNIQAHYDLGNEFFKCFLDKNLMYSSAIFKDEKSSLEEAALYKVNHICQKLKLKPQDKVLEIGTGWGTFALHAAKNYGCHVTTTTLSDKQYHFTLQKIKAAGLEKKITLLKKDYRDLTGRFDKLVSIEMIEAVGHQYFKTFFQKCQNLVKEDGALFLQAIVIIDQKYEKYKNSVDFIRHYIFPGGCLPSLKVIEDCITEVTDFGIYELTDITQHYARTLKIWRERLLKNWEKIKKLGYSEKFLRMWEFYFATCEGGFAENHVRDVQILFTKPLTHL